MQKLEWFVDRVGKKVYRDNACECKTCSDSECVYIIDEDHAHYLHMIQVELHEKGMDLDYRDTHF